MRIAMVSEHASPLAVLGGVDAGGQNVHVAALASALARRGNEVVVHTRRDDPASRAPRGARSRRRGRPRRRRPADGDPQGRAAAAHGRVRRRPARAVGGRAAGRRPRALLDVRAGGARRRARASASRSCRPSTRSARSSAATRARATRARAGGSRSSATIARSVDRIVATCTDEVFELLRMGADRRRITVVPCGVDLERFGADGPVERARRPPPPARGLPAGRAQGPRGRRDARSPSVPDAELLVAGGPEARRAGRRPRGAAAARARRAARRRRPARAARARRARRRCRRCCAPPTPSCACPGTSRSGSCRWRRWRAASRSWRRAVGGQIDSVVHGVTGRARPAARPARAGAGAARAARPTPRGARRSARPARGARAAALRLGPHRPRRRAQRLRASVATDRRARRRAARCAS